MLSSAAIVLAVLIAALNPSTLTFAIALVQSGIAAAQVVSSYRLVNTHSRLVQKQRDHEILLESVHYYPMPFALYDETDRLIVWNSAYEAIYANAFAQLQEKVDTNTVYYADLLRGNIDDAMCEDEIVAFIRKRTEEQRDRAGAVYDRHYPDLGWFRVSKHHTPSGAVAGFAIDINEMKQREVDLMEEIEQRKLLEQEVRTLAYTDTLTGVANRRAFLEAAEVEFDYAREHNTTLSVLMLDIDFFKNVNDTFGHAAGDDVIKQVAILTKANIATDDVLGRLGGEEFAVLLRDTNTAFDSAECIRNSISSTVFMDENETFQVTVSIGLSDISVHDVSFMDILKRSDELLYEAKLDGRNCTVTRTKKQARQITIL